MEEQFISLINGKITEHYQAAKTLLLNKANYKTSIDTQNVLLYFAFLESCLQLPYNRLHSVSVFIVGDDGQLTDKMYPFAFLTDEVKGLVKDRFLQAINLANSLEVSGIDPEIKALCQEQQLNF